jgi:hypothetical protein
MKRHGAANIPLAPVYLVALLLGMMGLILSPTMELRCCSKSSAGKGKLEATSSASTMSSVGPDADALLKEKDSDMPSRREYVVGVLLAILSGIFGGMKFSVSPIAHSVLSNQGVPEDEVDTLFNVFESYMMSFGIGCAVSTTAFFLIFAVMQKGVLGKDLPSPEFPVMKIYGFLAGEIWFCHYMCLHGANEIGGNGSFGPAGNASQLITAGLWGLLYYREVRDPRRVLCWVASAAWTIAFVVQLADEVQKKEASF